MAIFLKRDRNLKMIIYHHFSTNILIIFPCQKKKHSYHIYMREYDRVGEIYIIYLETLMLDLKKYIY